MDLGGMHVSSLVGRDYSLVGDPALESSRWRRIFPKPPNIICKASDGYGSRSSVIGAKKQHK